MIRLPERQWFELMQPLLLDVLSSHEGRALLCVDDQPYPVIAIEPGRVCYAISPGVHLSDFRTHNKWGKVVRHRWFEFQGLAKAFYRRGHLTYVRGGLLAAATSTFYPDPDPESSSVDGKVMRQGVDETWASIRGGAGNGSEDNNGNTSSRITCSTTSNQFATIERMCFLFATSSIPDGDVIESATFSLFGNAKDTTLGGNVCLVSSAPASSTALANGDYGSLGTTQYASDIAIGSYSTVAYNDQTLNADGRAAISKTGVTKLGVRLSHDRENSAPSWSSGAKSMIEVKCAETAGTTSDPKLVVVYSAPVGLLMVSD